MLGLLLKLLTSLIPFAFTAGNVLVGYLVVPLFNHIKKHWIPWLIGGLLVLNIGSGLLFYQSHKDLSIEKAAHSRDIQSYKDAKAEAEDKIQETKDKLEAKAKIDAKQSDQTYASLLKRYNASVLRYKAAESVRSRPRGSDSNSSTGVRQGASGDTELSAPITISGDDARICAVNTAKLQSLQAWALTIQGAR